MSGPVALLGGREHLPGNELVDRVLLSHLDVSDPLVAVIPAASAPRKRPQSIRLAREYWHHLGVDVRIVLPGAHDPANLEVIDGAALIVMPGGDPQRLMDELVGTPLLEHILARWHAGAGLSGSSAGAVALCERRVRLRPPDPLALVAGFGVVRSAVCAPHYEMNVARRAAHIVAWRNPHLTLLAMHERTALIILDEHKAEVAGAGSVTIIRSGERTTYQVGDRIDHDLELLDVAPSLVV